jgi:tetratricopeptide (TPR) repeat protein
VDANAMLAEARQATKEKHWDESDALMKKLTANYPSMVLAWVELGLAQMGLEHYDHAENSFKIALGIDPGSQAVAHDGDFYQKVDAPGVVAPGATRGSMIGGTRTNAEKRTPDVLGTAYASLGEIYIHEKKFPEAKEAFDTERDHPLLQGGRLRCATRRCRSGHRPRPHAGNALLLQGAGAGFEGDGGLLREDPAASGMLPGVSEIS